MTITFAEDCFDFYPKEKREQKINFCRNVLKELPAGIVQKTFIYEESLMVDDNERDIIWLFFIDEFNLNSQTLHLSWGGSVS